VTDTRKALLDYCKVHPEQFERLVMRYITHAPGRCRKEYPHPMDQCVEFKEGQE
jgi:hypothetical protein